MRKNLLALAAVAMMSASASAMYIVGDPVEGGWNPANGIEMTATSDNTWEWTCTIGTGQWFAFATDLVESGDWNEFNSTYRLNPEANNTVAEEGTYNLVLGGSDKSFKGSGAEATYVITESNGSYTLSVTLQGEPEPVDMSLYLRGAMNDWEALDDYKFTEGEDGVYTLALAELEGGVEFKIATSDWATDYSSGKTDMEMNLPYVVNPAIGNMAMASTCKDATLILNTNEMTFEVVANPQSKVEEINVAGTEAVYYNLQGVKIAKPEKGIVIRVANGKSEKVVF